MHGSRALAGCLLMSLLTMRGLSVCPLGACWFAGYNTTWHWCNRWWTTPDIERPVVRHHGLPIASYRDAAWPVLNSPRPDLPCLFNGKSHPESITHTMIGDVVTYGLIRAAYDSSMQMTDCDSQPPPTTFHQKLELVEYCPTGSAASSTGTFMTAFQETDFDAVSAGQWLWREDVPGKPGNVNYIQPVLCQHTACWLPQVAAIE